MDVKPEVKSLFWSLTLGAHALGPSSADFPGLYLVTILEVVGGGLTCYTIVVVPAALLLIYFIANAPGRQQMMGPATLMRDRDGVPGS